MNDCWHCKGTGQCRCLSCAGPCEFCKGRDFIERHRAILDQVDPREHRYWERHAAHDGTPPYREFLPFRGLK